MSSRGIIGRNASHGNVERFPIEDGNNPSNRADEPRAIKPGPCHGFPPDQIVDRTRQCAGQDLLCRAASLDLFGRKVLAFGRLHEIHGVDVNTLLLGEAQRRACRRADGIISHRLWRAGNLKLYIRLLNREAPDPSC